MGSQLVNVRVHYGNGFINYCDSGVDLSQFQYVDTTVTNPLHMRHADLLSWMHNFLQVDPSHWTIKLVVLFQGIVSTVGGGNYVS